MPIQESDPALVGKRDPALDQAADSGAGENRSWQRNVDYQPRHLFAGPGENRQDAEEPQGEERAGKSDGSCNSPVIQISNCPPPGQQRQTRRRS